MKFIGQIQMGSTIADVFEAPAELIDGDHGQLDTECLPWKILLNETDPPAVREKTLLHEMLHMWARLTLCLEEEGSEELKVRSAEEFLWQAGVRPPKLV